MLLFGKLHSTGTACSQLASTHRHTCCISFASTDMRSRTT